jgi:hypothetical protein
MDLLRSSSLRTKKVYHIGTNQDHNSDGRHNSGTAGRSGKEEAPTVRVSEILRRKGPATELGEGAQRRV